MAIARFGYILVLRKSPSVNSTWSILFSILFFFQFILLFLYKVATGQLKEIKDTREDEDVEESEKKKQ
jgi:hypothetical protein